MNEGQIWSESFDSDVRSCDLYGSFFVCGGRRKNVLEIYAKEASNSDKNILELMQEALRSRYFNSYVGMKQTSQIIVNTIVINS